MTKKIIYPILIVVGLLLVVGYSSAETNNISITNPLNVNTFQDLLTQIATGIGTLIASLGVIMLIWSGILYLTSGGSQERLGSAKKALIYAVLGIAIGVAANLIVIIVKNVLGVSS